MFISGVAWQKLPQIGPKIIDFFFWVKWAKKTLFK
jgi:hypothetical protein